MEIPPLYAQKIEENSTKALIIEKDLKFFIDKNNEIVKKNDDQFRKMNELKEVYNKLKEHLNIVMKIGNNNTKKIDSFLNEKLFAKNSEINSQFILISRRLEKVENNQKSLKSNLSLIEKIDDLNSQILKTRNKVSELNSDFDKKLKFISNENIQTRKEIENKLELYYKLCYNEKIMGK